MQTTLQAAILDQQKIQECNPPLCEELYRLVCRAATVQAVSEAFEAHAHSGCSICCPRKEAAKAEVELKQERRAA